MVVAELGSLIDAFAVDGSEMWCHTYIHSHRLGRSWWVQIKLIIQQVSDAENNANVTS
jgi:hypothetical protein